MSCWSCADERAEKLCTCRVLHAGVSFLRVSNWEFEMKPVKLDCCVTVTRCPLIIQLTDCAALFL